MTASDYTRAQDVLLSAHGVTAESRMVEVPSLQTRVHVLVSGEGPPLVMMIGGGVPAAMWASLMGQLRERTLYAVDLPNQGLSEAVTWTTEKYATMGTGFTAEVLDGVGLRSAHIVAQSMGGLFATWLAIALPERVKSITYVGCPAFFLDSSAPLPLRLLSVPGLGRLLMGIQPPSPRQVASFAKMAGEDFSDKPQLAEVILEMERMPSYAPGLRSLMRATIGLRGPKPGLRVSARDLSLLTVPTQFIWGEHDPFGTVDVVRRAAAAIPRASLHVVPGGHAPWLERPEEIGGLVRAFIEEGSDITR